MTFSIKSLYVTLYITMPCHYNGCHVLFTIELNIIMLSVGNAEYRYVECRYALCMLSILYAVYAEALCHYADCLYALRHSFC